MSFIQKGDILADQGDWVASPLSSETVVWDNCEFFRAAGGSTTVLATTRTRMAAKDDCISCAGSDAEEWFRLDDFFDGAEDWEVEGPRFIRAGVPFFQKFEPVVQCWEATAPELDPGERVTVARVRLKLVECKG